MPVFLVILMVFIVWMFVDLVFEDFEDFEDTRSMYNEMYCYASGGYVQSGSIGYVEKRSETDWDTELQVCKDEAATQRAEYLSWCQPRIETLDWNDYQKCKMFQTMLPDIENGESDIISKDGTGVLNLGNTDGVGVLHVDDV